MKPSTFRGSTQAKHNCIAVEFETEIIIHRPLEEVFAFFRDIDRYAGVKGSVVPVYEKLTPGKIGVGTRYREIVRFLPFVKGEGGTQVTGYDAPRRLDYGFVAFGVTRPRRQDAPQSPEP